MDSIPDCAQWFHNQSIPIIPMRYVWFDEKGNKLTIPNKVPYGITGWKRWEKEAQTEQEWEQIKKLLLSKDCDGWAIICGTKGKNGLYIIGIDFDHPFEQFDWSKVPFTAYEISKFKNGLHLLYWSEQNDPSTGEPHNYEFLGKYHLCVMYPMPGACTQYEQIAKVPSALKIFQDSAEALDLGYFGTEREVIDVTRLLEGSPEHGDNVHLPRDKAAIRIISYWRGQKKKTKDEASKLAEEWNKKNTGPLEESVLRRKLNQAYKGDHAYWPLASNWTNEPAEVAAKDQDEPAPNILKNPELWSIIDENLEVKIKLDPVGRKTTFLTECTAFQKRPSHLLLIGGSALGKTWLAQKCAELLPEKHVQIIGSSTQRAWFYCGTPIYEEENGKKRLHHYEINWTNTVVIILDNVDENTIKDLKPVMSHDNYGRTIDIQATMRTQGGKYRTVPVRITGCPCFINCSTRLTWNEELSTRHFFLTPVDSHEKFDASLKFIGKREIENAEPPLPNGKEIQSAIQWLIKHNQQIVIAEDVEKTVREQFPAYAAREIRDFERILTMIEAHAWLYSEQRERNTKSHVVATMQDYEAIKDLTTSIMRMSKYSTNEQVIDFYEKVLLPQTVSTLTSSIELKTKQISKLYIEHYHRTISTYTLRKYLETLETLGLVESKIDTGDRRRLIYTINATEL